MRLDSELSRDISATPQYDKVSESSVRTNTTTPKANSSIADEVRGLSKNCAETSLKGCRTSNSADSREIRCETNLQKALVSQRLHHHTPYNELWECLDSKLQSFLLECGILGLGVSFTQIEHAESLMKEADLLVLSGGNDIGAYPQRDNFELKLLECALKQGKKVLGICRGAQMIATYFGANLAQSTHKIKELHALEGSINRAGKLTHSVHSYHNFCIQNMPSDFEILAMAGGEIEAFCNEQILAFMWHPEREETREIESCLVREFLGARILGIDSKIKE